MASSEAILTRNQGDLWDSGKVNADESIQMPYGGKPLSSGQVVWWKVRVWDNDAKPSAWSEPARWSMGLLAASDWKGNGSASMAEKGSRKSWPALSGLAPRTPLPERSIFRRTFEVSTDNPVSDALLFMVGSGPTTLTINGGDAQKSEGVKDPFSIGYHRFFAHGHQLAGRYA